MKQSINLYTEDFRPKQIWVSFYQLLIGSVLTVIALIGISVGIKFSSESAEEQLTDRERTVETLRARIETMNAQLKLQTLDESLVASNKVLAADVKAHQSLLETVQSLVGEERKVLSDYFIGLARQSSSKLSLSVIEIDDDKDSMLLAGTTSSASAVPEFLGRLSKEDNFAGTRFQNFDLSETENRKLLSFKIAALGEEPANVDAEPKGISSRDYIEKAYAR